MTKSASISDSARENSTSADGSDEVLCSWRAHPARHRPAAAIGGLLVIMAFGALLGGLSFGEGMDWLTALGLGLGAGAVLLLSLHRFYFPGTYEVRADAIHAETVVGGRVLHWRDVRQFGHGDDGAFLATRAGRGFLVRLSGMHVVFDPTDRDRVTTAIEERLAAVKGATP